MRRRLRIDFDDGEGGRYSITLEGSLSREKVLKILDMVELLRSEGEGEGEDYYEEALRRRDETSFAKLYHLIEKRFPLGAFTSSDLREAYEDEYGRPIKLSTISTYLARLVERGKLKRRMVNGTFFYRRMRARSDQAEGRALSL